MFVSLVGRHPYPNEPPVSVSNPSMKLLYSLGHRLLQGLVDGFAEAFGRTPCLVGAARHLGFLRPPPALDWRHRHLLERVGVFLQRFVVVELGAMGEAAAPGEDRGGRIGRGLLAFLMQPVMARDRAVGGFRLDRLPVRR